MTEQRTIAFLGASGGIGLIALKRALADRHTCSALCRIPSKLEAHFPTGVPSNLTIKSGNAKDIDAVASILVSPTDPTKIVDNVSFSIGGAPVMNGWTPAIDDPNVCGDGIASLLSALDKIRQGGAQGRPVISVISTTGISKHQEDVPFLFRGLYHWALKVPHVDKKLLEERVVGSGETFVIVRASLLVDITNGFGWPVRVGIEDPKGGVESTAVGHIISREAVAGWLYENVLARELDPEYSGKALGLTW